jgi:hypothetical protein
VRWRLCSVTHKRYVFNRSEEALKAGNEVAGSVISLKIDR